MAEAFLVDAVRTPVGRRGGGLAAAHPADLGAHVIAALLARTGLDPLAVDDVIFGCVDTIGPQAGDIARTAWLAAGLPEAVPGVTVDRQCGSSQQAVHFAAQAVLSGTADLVVAGGVQNMSQIPIAAAMLAGRAYGAGDPFSGSDGWRARYGAEEISQFRAADLIADKWGIGRAGDGAVRAGQPPAGGAGDRGGRLRRRDRAVRRTCARTSARAGTRRGEDGRAGRRCAKAAGSPPRWPARSRTPRPPCWSPRPGRSAQHGLRPRARIRHLSARGDDPVLMLTAPIAATAHALRRAGMTLDQIDLVEINEAFASVVLAWQRETGADLARVNVSGGAIALGHPLGATGARLLTTLLHALERTGGRYGLVTMCEGGGQANVTIIERL